MAGHLAPGGAYKYFARGKTLTRVKSWRKGEFTSPAQVKSMGSPPGEAGWDVPPAQGMDEGHGAEVVLGSGIDEVKVFWQFHHIHDMGDLFRFAEGRRVPVLAPAGEVLSLTPELSCCACSRRPASLRLGLVCGPLCGPALVLAAVHPGCSRRLRASLKVPKERVQGECPLDTPRSVWMRPSLSGVRNRTVCRFHQRPMALCGYAFGGTLHPVGRLPG